MLLFQWFYNNNATLLQRSYVTAMLLQPVHNATTTLLRYYNMTLWSEGKRTAVGDLEII
jgi:hypothetical protein